MATKPLNIRILVLRFSAMGDVALLTPVLTALSRKYSSLSVTLVTRKDFEPFFYNIPGVEVIGVNLKKHYRGIYGLYRLYRELRKLGPYNFGVDVHGSTRSRLLRLFFLFSGLKFSKIVKGRREKFKQTRKSNKILTPLPHMVDRYMRVFERAGLGAVPEDGPYINPDTNSRALARNFLDQENLSRRENYWIGIAPFAGHAPKMWPLEKTEALLGLIEKKINATIFLFGGGEQEIDELRRIQKQYKSTVLVAGKLSLDGEIALVKRMQLMLAMDSFNMHLAALLGVPLLSIWGSTHPYSGFGPYRYDESSIIQIAPEQLECRPCSIFGNKGCARGDLACLNFISPEHVLDRIEHKLYDPANEEDLPQTD